MRKVIYGLGMSFEEYLISSNYDTTDIVAFADKQPEKKGKNIDGIKVISPEELVDFEYDYIMVTSEKYYDDIRIFLIDLGCDEKKIKLLKYKTDKYTGEMAYWQERFRTENGCFLNDGYKELFLGIANEKDDTFLKDKIVADFGCGPRGSLAWTNVPKVKIGIDVLVNSYMKRFGCCMTGHGMIYVNSDETNIPLPNDYVDVLCTINSLDHVSVIDNMVNELCRILKRGGLFLGCFNLNEPKTKCEPQTLTEELLESKLLDKFEVLDKKIAKKGSEDTYSEIKNGNLVDCLGDDEPGEMWIKAILK